MLRTITIRDFSVGQVSKDLDFLIPDNALSLCKNGIVGRDGVKKRNGYIKYNSSAIDTSKVSSIVRFTLSSGTHYFLAFCGTDIYQADLANKTFSSIYTGVTADLLWDFGFYNDKLYMSNGTDDLLSYDGTTVSALSSLPKGKYLVVLKDRLWVAGVSSAPYRLYYSDVGDPETFGANNYIDFPESPYANEGIITGLGILGSDLVVFKENATYMVIERPAGSFSVIQVDAFKGCVAHHSICNIPNGLLFLSDDGVYLLTSSSLKFIGEPIKDYTDDRATAQIYKAVSCFYDNCYYLSYPTSGSSNNNQTVVLNTLGGWSVFPNYGFHYFSVWEDGTIYGAGDAGYVYQLDTGDSDDGNDIDFVMATKSYGDDEYKTFRLLGLDVDGLGVTLNAKVSVDGGIYSNSRSIVTTSTVGSTFGSATFGTSTFAGGNIFKTVPLALVGRRIKAEISDNSQDGSFTVKSIYFKFRYKRRR